jgi:hypothetical protein
MIKLIPLKAEAVGAAIEMAKRYRLLNEPEEAESICLDILKIAPDHQEAMITHLLALTDKFSSNGLDPAFFEAREVVEKLNSRYCRSYYSGIIYERRAKYHLRSGTIGSEAIAYEYYNKAMHAFDKALATCDPGNQDAVLRWNTCARFINSHPELSLEESPQDPLIMDAFETPH